MKHTYTVYGYGNSNKACTEDDLALAIAETVSYENDRQRPGWHWYALRQGRLIDVPLSWTGVSNGETRRGSVQINRHILHHADEVIGMFREGTTLSSWRYLRHGDHWSLYESDIREGR